jgi:hypothetical protein
MRAEQTVSEMVVEVLARQAEALSEESGRSFDEAFAEVLRTRAGRQLTELADGPHRHERAAEWQGELLADRQVKRPAHLREPGGAGSRHSWLEDYAERAEAGERCGTRYQGPIRRSQKGATT